MIRAHSDLLAIYNGQSRRPIQRREDLARLSGMDITDIIAFLTALETKE